MEFGGNHQDGYSDYPGKDSVVMAEITQGSVTISIPEGIEIPEKAGSLSTAELRRLPKAGRGA